MRILIVEDEPRVVSFLRNALSEEGQAVVVASDGDAGLQLALAEDFDLIVLDWLLPERDGLSVCRAIRAARQSTPILMLTARDAIDDRIAGLDSGADDYLIKPFALGEFLARVRSLLRRRTADLPVLTAGDIALDPSTHKVTLKGVDVSLTAREFSLLEYLIRNKGRVLTRAMICDHVWDFDGGTNVVDVYINYVRNKVDPDHQVIKTVRGVGYRLDVADG